ncbi:hypothetical protein LguiA_033051 [Lonicera macranthoides]
MIPLFHLLLCVDNSYRVSLYPISRCKKVHVLPREILGKSTFELVVSMMNWLPIGLVDKIMLVTGKMCGRVELVNGENIEIDSVILATGYCSNVPSWLKVEDGEVLNGGPAQTIPPSFKQGVDLGTLKAQLYLWKVYDDQGAVKSTSDVAKPVSCCSVLKLWQRLMFSLSRADIDTTKLTATIHMFTTSL